MMEMKMKNLIAALADRAAKQAKYRHLRNELAGLSQREALDLGIYREDAARIAAQAVWG